MPAMPLVMPVMPLFCVDRAQLVDALGDVCDHGRGLLHEHASGHGLGSVHDRGDVGSLEQFDKVVGQFAAPVGVDLDGRPPWW